MPTILDVSIQSFATLSQPNIIPDFDFINSNHGGGIKEKVIVL
jgi:hypothetical protein